MNAMTNPLMAILDPVMEYTNHASINMAKIPPSPDAAWASQTRTYLRLRINSFIVSLSPPGRCVREDACRFSRTETSRRIGRTIFPLQIFRKQAMKAIRHLPSQGVAGLVSLLFQHHSDQTRRPQRNHMVMHGALGQSRMADDFHKAAGASGQIAEDAQAVFVRQAAGHPEEGSGRISLAGGQFTGILNKEQVFVPLIKVCGNAMDLG